MGTKASSAIPALLETWVRDDQRTVKLRAAAGLEALLHDPRMFSRQRMEPRDWESDVIAEAVRRYPEVARKLKIPPVAPVAAADPSGY